MDKQKIAEILDTVNEVIADLSEDEKSALYYLKEIKGAAEVLIFSGY